MDDQRLSDITLATKHLQDWIPAEDVLQVNQDGLLFVRGKPLADETAQAIREQAKSLIGSPLWGAIKDEIRYHAHARAFEKAQTIDDLIIGKSALWVLQLIDKKIELLANL